MSVWYGVLIEPSVRPKRAIWICTLFNPHNSKNYPPFYNAIMLSYYTTFSRKVKWQNEENKNYVTTNFIFIDFVSKQRDLRKVH